LLGECELGEGCEGQHFDGSPAGQKLAQLRHLAGIGGREHDAPRDHARVRRAIPASASVARCPAVSLTTPSWAAARSRASCAGGNGFPPAVPGPPTEPPAPALTTVHP